MKSKLFFGGGIAIASIAIICSLLYTRDAGAVGLEGIINIPEAGKEIPFGGKHILTLDCDCGGNSRWILDYRTNKVIKLYKSDQSKFYEYYNADGEYQLGTYSTDSESCKMEVEEICITIENDGTYGSHPGTGTTLD